MLKLAVFFVYVYSCCVYSQKENWLTKILNQVQRIIF